MDDLTSHPHRAIATRKGSIRFPAYIPVTTFGTKYPLDDLVRPYLSRLASAIMVSYHYAKQQKTPFRLPMMVDSGGFASLFDRADVIEEQGLGIIRLATEDGFEFISPSEVLEFQEQKADLAFTLDFPIPPSMELELAKVRQRLTISNAIWALNNRRRSDLPLFACIQGWDIDSYLDCAKTYAQLGFDGVAIGGLVPRARDKELIKSVVAGARSIVGEMPLHVFGLGKPELADLVFDSGADSVDSSSYLKLAASGLLWGSTAKAIASPTPTQRLHLAICNLANATRKNLPLSVSPHLLQIGIP